jgi:hypothetical protein
VSSTLPRPVTRFLLALLGAGVFLALLRLSVGAGASSMPGRAGVTDLVGCALAAASLWAVLGLRELAAGRPLPEVLEDGLASVALAVWLFALVPPRAEAELAGGADDFAQAYAPASVAAYLLVLAARPWWPGRTPRDAMLRHQLGLVVLLLSLGGLVAHLVGGPGALHVLHRCLLLAVLAGGAWGLARWRFR